MRCSLRKRKPFYSNFYPLPLIFAANFEMGMAKKSIKSLLVAVFSMFTLLFSTAAFANEAPQKEGAATEGKKEAAFDPAKLIMEHIMDAHEFHFFSVGETHVSIPLPVILYSPQRGLSVFSYGNFHHGHEVYNGYKSEEGKIVAVNEAGEIDAAVVVYDFSLTRNVVQMFLALGLLVWLMIGVANKYKKNGAKVAPSGFQNAIEPVITFVRDEVGKPNLGHAYEKYMPYLLTIFFFILINNIVGLIPGTANVTGNIAFTAVLGFISFLVIVFSTNRHFWAHIFNPPVPFLVKFILVPVEFIGIFTKPFALIIRLFANMVAGHIIITCFIMLIFIFGAMSKVAGIGFTPVSLAFTIFIYFIEILVAFIQAFIFTNLTAVFIGQSMEGAHHEEAHH
ncbi:MAG: F-type H+-transporting ATPase subunit a [Chitinophagaceae bacterium]|nr:MAG: F-type H+-transporting ATPase subunit a [Chitinophagaceae bacterium]